MNSNKELSHDRWDSSFPTTLLQMEALCPTTGAVSVFLCKVVIFKIKNGIIMGMVTFIKPDILEKKVENNVDTEVSKWRN